MGVLAPITYSCHPTKGPNKQPTDQTTNPQTKEPNSKLDNQPTDEATNQRIISIWLLWAEEGLGYFG